MADLVGRVQNALNEARILVLVGQVLFAYSFEAAFEPKFETLPQPARLAGLAGITLLLLALAFLMTPAAFHVIVEKGDDCEGFHEVTTAFVTIVLPIFAAAAGLEVFMMASSAFGPLAAALLGGGFFAWALFFWVGLELLARRRRGRA